MGRYLRVNTENTKIANELLSLEGGREAVVAMGFSVQEGTYYKLAADVTNDHLNKCSAEVPQQRTLCGSRKHRSAVFPTPGEPSH